MNVREAFERMLLWAIQKRDKEAEELCLYILTNKGEEKRGEGVLPLLDEINLAING
jgi:hypothetical protein